MRSQSHLTPAQSEQLMDRVELRRIESRRFSDRMKAALRKTLNGTSYRAAGSECGVDYRDLHKNAKRLGLDRAHLEAWRDYWGPAIAPAWKHHLRRLDDDLDEAV